MACKSRKVQYSHSNIFLFNIYISPKVTYHYENVKFYGAYLRIILGLQGMLKFYILASLKIFIKNRTVLVFIMDDQYDKICLHYSNYYKQNVQVWSLIQWNLQEQSNTVYIWMMTKQTTYKYRHIYLQIDKYSAEELKMFLLFSENDRIDLCHVNIFVHLTSLSPTSAHRETQRISRKSIIINSSKSNFTFQFPKKIPIFRR